MKGMRGVIVIVSRCVYGFVKRIIGNLFAKSFVYMGIDESL